MNLLENLTVTLSIGPEPFQLIFLFTYITMANIACLREEDLLKRLSRVGLQCDPTFQYKRV